MKKYLILISGLSISLIAFAEEHGHHIPSIWDTRFFWLNFIIYVSVLTYLLKKPITNGWTARRDAIESAVNSGKRELEAAQDKLQAAEGKMRMLDQEIIRITRDIETETQRESTLLIQDASKRAERIQVQAKEMADAEIKNAKAKIRAEVIDAVMKKAEDKIMQQVNESSDVQLRAATLGAVKGNIH